MIAGMGGAAHAGESRVIYPTATDFADSLDDTVLTINGVATVRTNALASLRLSVGVGCTRIVVVVNANLTSSPDTTVGVLVDGVYQSLTPPAVSALHNLPISIDPTAAHVVEITPGWCQYGTGGTWIHAVSCEGGSVVVLPNPSVDRRIVVLGDSIAVGSRAVPIPRDGWIQRLRLVYPGRIAMEGWGGKQMVGVAEVGTLAERLVGLCFDATTREVWDALGYNDWAGSRALAEYQSTTAALYDAIHALAPDARVFCQTPIITGDEVATNGLGNTIGQQRAAKASAATGRSWVTVVDGTTLISAAKLSDGIHPTADGDADYAANVATVIDI